MSLRAYLRFARTAPRRMPTPYRRAARSLPALATKLAGESLLPAARQVPFDLKQLASLRAASLVGCTW